MAKRRKPGTNAGSAKKRSARKRTAPARAGGRARPPAILADLKKADGCVAAVRVGERNGGETDYRESAARVVAATTRQAKRRSPRVSPRACAAMAAVGHAVRARVLLKLLEGPATYQALRKTTKLEAGPLYHHIGQLRLAELILPKQRDLYELTRAGRNLVLVAMALDPMLKDTRRRPLGAQA